MLGAEQLGGRLVGEDDALVGIGECDRLGDVDEDRLEPLLDPAHLGIEAGVVDRQRRAPCELGDDLEIIGTVGPAAPEPQNRERAERSAARE